jgi:hypothetical protein
VFYEEPAPLHEITVRLNLPLPAVSARAVVAGTALPVRRTPGGGAEVSVPKVPIHEIVCFELG